MTSRITVQIPPNDLSSIIDAANLSRRNSGKQYIDTAECATLTQKAMKDSATIRVTSHNLALDVSICRVCHLRTREIERGKSCILINKPVPPTAEVVVEADDLTNVVDCRGPCIGSAGRRHINRQE